MTPPRLRRVAPYLVEVAAGSAPEPVVYAAGHAGAGARWAVELAEALPPGWGLRALLLPGREARAPEPFATDAADEARAWARDIAAHHPPGRPAALFGQSLGALLAFDACRSLEEEGVVIPAALAVLGAPAPRMERRCGERHASDQALLRELYACGAVPAPVLADDALRARILAVLRSDMAMYDGYSWGTEASVACPLTALRGTGDRTVSPADVDGWAAAARGRFTRVEVAGGHLPTRAAAAAWVRSLRATEKGIP